MFKVIELFSGIGAQRKALENIGIPHKVIGISEIDKYALQSYEAIYGPTQNFGDIRSIEKLPYADLWTYSSPCQDISVAGKQKGLSGGTRSGLLYEVGRLLEVAASENTLPKYLLLENVRNLVSKRFYSEFSGWLDFLDRLGYDTYWQVLNAKDYGIPQNRERVYGVSIRKDLNQKFSFPGKEELKIKLSDLLDSEVDEKYYISEEKMKSLIKSMTAKGLLIKEGTIKGYKEAEVGDSINIEYPTSTTRRGRVGKQVSQTLTTSPQQVVIGGVVKNCGKEFVKTTDIAKTLLARDYKGFGNQDTNCAVKQIGNFLETQRFGGNPQDGRVYDESGISPTLSTKPGPFVLNDLLVRRLIPLECWRLMGFDDADFFAAKCAGLSDTQLYKQAGNSIVVKVLEKIFLNLLI